MENMDQNTNETAGAGEKTFTQEEVNRIVGERLSKEKSKGNTDFSKREQELLQRELRLSAKEMLSSKGLSVQLADPLDCTSQESLEKGISLIEAAFNEYSGAIKRNIKIIGAVPGQSGVGGKDTPADDSIRKAMGLH